VIRRHDLACDFPLGLRRHTREVSAEPTWRH
jgi:hypothetical protein